MNTVITIPNMDEYLIAELKSLIGFNFASINSASYRRIYNELDKFHIEGKGYIYFYNEKTNEKRFLTMTFVGYDSILRNQSEYHGFNVNLMTDENATLDNSDVLICKSSIGFPDFKLQAISFWYMGYEEEDYPRNNDLIVFEFTNEYRIFFVLGSRADVDIHIQRKDVVDFFNQYPDNKERELVMLYSTEL